MQRRATAVFVFGMSLAAVAATVPPSQRNQEITPAPHGPFHVSGNQIVDSSNQPILLRGTQLTEFRLETVARDNRSGLDFGPHSATALSAIRLRLNMNMVRLPVNVEQAHNPQFFPELAKVVQRVNHLDLLAILAPVQASPAFWAQCAAFFKDYPNLIFDVAADPDLIPIIRSGGAHQPVALKLGVTTADADVIFEVSPKVQLTDAARDAQFGLLADQAPVFSLWDLNLADAAECSAIPSDPAEAAQLVEHNLSYFDTHRISWSVSEYAPGRMIKDSSLLDATSLEYGWTCGKPAYPQAGLGRIVEAYMEAFEERGLFVVSAGGGPDISRGGFAVAYGPVMAAHDTHAAAGRPLPQTLAKISVEVTDSQGATRKAGILWASEGWGQVNFIVPTESAIGPARMTIVRWDGTRRSAPIIIADTSPGFWTGVSCRGPARGSFVQVLNNGRTVKSDLSKCSAGDCQSLTIPVASGARTRIRMDASGFRNARSAADIEITVGDIRLPVVSFGPGDDPGVDQVTVEIPPALSGLGEVDVVAHVNGRVSNAVQIRIGT